MFKSHHLKTLWADLLLARRERRPNDEFELVQRLQRHLTPKDAARLIKLLESEDNEIGGAACSALMDFYPVDVRAIMRLWRHPNPDIRARAVAALGGLGPQHDAVPPLLDALADSDPEIRSAAIKVIQPLCDSLGRDDNQPLQPDYPPAREIVSGLVQSLLSDSLDQHSRRGAIGALASLGKAARDAVIPILQQMGGGDELMEMKAQRALRSIGVAALPGIITAQRSRDVPLRDAARRALELFDDEECKPYLEMLRDEATAASLAASQAYLWDAEAGKSLPRVKLFYLVYRAYMEGAKSMKDASKLMGLEGRRYRLLDADGIPKQFGRFANYIRELEPLYAKILGTPGYRMFSVEWRESTASAYRFSDDARKAWEWTDAFLRRQISIPRDWYGFSRLSPP